MRAWVDGDARTLKALTTRDFILLTASEPLTLLDRPSWLDAATRRYRASSYRFDHVYVSAQGEAALFAAPFEIEARLDGQDWSGSLFITDLWRRGRVRRKWRLSRRVVARRDSRPDLASSIKSLQLWRS